jgi:hypothetical protein
LAPEKEMLMLMKSDKVPQGTSPYDGLPGGTQTLKRMEKDGDGEG